MNMKKKVLLITIHFYDYIDKISREIESIYGDSNIHVIYTNFKIPFFLKPIFKILHGDRFYDIICDAIQYFNYKKCRKIEYDDIFILTGYFVNIKYLKHFLIDDKVRKPHLILYLWDSKKNVKKIDDIIQIVDNIYTFDKDDAEKNNYNFLPLFYTEDFVYRGEKKIYDLFAIGSNHSNRIKLFDKYYNIFFKNNKKVFLKIYTTLFQYIKYIYFSKNNNKKLISTKTYSLKQTSELMKCSKIALDIPLKNQSGLSIRTIESIASNTKLITYNKCVKDYDFYNSNNIFVVNDNDEFIPQNFINSDYASVSSDIIEKYSLKNWVKTILNIEKDL